MKTYIASLARHLRQLRHAMTTANVLPTPASFIEVERAERIFYLEYLREGMTVFDAGANIGELTLLFARFVGARGCVHAFEPCGSGFERLSAVCHAAALRNVCLNRLALAEEEGTVRLHVYDDDYLSWTTRAERPLEDYGIEIRPRATEEVPATTVDLYCERHDVEVIDLLKVDVEGAEFQVLLGARRMLRERRVRLLTFEFGQTTFDMGNSPDGIRAYLTEVGYDLSNLVRGDPIFPGEEGAQTASFSMHAATPQRRRQ